MPRVFFFFFLFAVVVVVVDVVRCKNEIVETDYGDF